MSANRPCRERTDGVRALHRALLVLGLLLMGSGVALAERGGKGTGSAATVIVISNGGPIQIKTPSGLETLPGMRVELSRSETLVLDEGTDVFIYNYAQHGEPLRKTGPDEVPLSSLVRIPLRDRRKEKTQRGLFDPRSRSSRPGASRGAPYQGKQVRLLRPVAGSVYSLEGQTIRWECDACGPRRVEVFDPTHDLVWSGEGEGSIQYKGPSLEAGSFALVLDGLRGPVTLYALDPQETQRMGQALSFCREEQAQLRKVGVDDPAALAACSIDAYRLAGLYSDALTAVDRLLAQQPGDPRIQGLLDVLERDAGLRE